MKELFKNIEEEKRDRIINSALKEFSINKYDKASTNAIIKEAGISKGALYHYFSSKEELFHMLKSFSMEIIFEEISTKVNWEETDFFKRVKEVVMIKINVTARYPHIYDFLSMVMRESSIDDMKKETQSYSPDIHKKIYTENIDFSLFKDGLDMKKTLSIIRWTFEKYGEENFNAFLQSGKPFDIKAIEYEFNEYSDILKSAFYK